MPAVCPVAAGGAGARWKAEPHPAHLPPPPQKKTLVDLINARRPSNVAPLRQVELPHMVVAGEAEPVDGAAPRAPPTAEQEEARRRSYAELYLSAPAALSHIRSYFAADFERLGFPTSLPPKGDLQQAQMHQAQPAVVAQQQSEQPAGGGALQ